MSIQVTAEHLDALRTLQTNFDSLTKRFGELRFQQILVEDEMAEVSTAMREIEAGRALMVTKMQETYGSTGQVNLQTGEFIPD